MTSPNQDWIPAHPVERPVVRTYTDGLWGEHEYSRGLSPCRHSAPHVPAVLWSILEESSVGVPGLGYLKHDLRSHLENAGRHAIGAFSSLQNIPPQRLCMDRMNRLPSHDVRVALELLGLHQYLTVVLPRLESTGDFSAQILPDATTAQLAARIGLPTWFLQPLTKQVKIWKVVKSTTPFFLSGTETSPPMRHHPDELGAIANLTSSWSSNLVFAVTGDLCAGRLPALERALESHVNDSGPSTQDGGPMKTRRVELKPIPTQGTIGGALGGKSRKNKRGGRRAKAPPATGQPGTQPGSATPTAIAVDARPLSAEVRHPSRHFTDPMFVSAPECWRIAQRAISPLPQPRQSVHYFYPPPFLLDTVARDDAEGVRRDDKVNRYLHNAVRIREFCRLRLLDIALAGEPLTIAEWRAALWGDYCEVDTGLAPDLAARVKRKLSDKNGVARLFGTKAALPSYSEDQTISFAGMTVSQETAVTDPRVRLSLLWECHEVNFRCELMALDSALVPRAGWPVVHRWAREAFVAGIWGEGGSLASVIPLETDTGFCWPSGREDGWQGSTRNLRRFLAVLSSWPGCPENIKSARTAVDWSSDDYDVFQLAAARFYTLQFATMFGRMPIYPVPRPTDG
ncbi:uncharacterized protein BXZ73DRAFT_93349 [Epithele typhae]|uniref:uncharacterized protein n=1 Tax=Epithele typhae TaxID=378194 RepID=UPI00200736D0|nr:uncharacterized protein BXZ73DRAFT_93349 [Epithele typhae]KAH9911620.1 hypothetical protein BXZ73DRAFT_93349 [Epithele typhae]